MTRKGEVRSRAGSCHPVVFPWVTALVVSPWVTALVVSPSHQCRVGYSVGARLAQGVFSKNTAVRIVAHRLSRGNKGKHSTAFFERSSRDFSAG